MANESEQPMAWGMTYQQCRKACMTTALGLANEGTPLGLPRNKTRDN